MTTVVPALPNYEMIDSNNVIKVTIHTSQVDSRLKIVSGIAFFCWILLGAFVWFLVNAAIREFMGPGTIALIIPFGMWFVMGASIIIVIIFRLTFQETVTVNHEAIKIEYESWLFKKRSSQYLARHIQRLRPSPVPLAFLWSGRIVFDYGGKTYYFGHKLNESEARQILSTIKTKFDNYDLAK